VKKEGKERNSLPVKICPRRLATKKGSDWEKKIMTCTNTQLLSLKEENEIRRSNELNPREKKRRKAIGPFFRGK